MDDERIRLLLREATAAFDLEIEPRQMEQFFIHFALLLKWNEKINLTSIRNAEEIATRHFGESLFLSTLLSRPHGLMVDVGSGAGFPGLPLKVVWPEVETVLIEANQKKATFLKEVIRACGLQGIGVRAERLEDICEQQEMAEQAALVTMRAVAPTPQALAAAARLLSPSGQIARFSSEEATEKLPIAAAVEWQTLTAIPQSLHRVIQIGKKRSK